MEYSKIECTGVYANQRVDSAELLEYLLPALDECGWQQLQQHELLQDYSVYVLARLPADDAQRLWSRLEV
ncbi:hypothetical protein GGH16_003257, partial [Coemansia sp. RSA 560]